MKRKLLITLIIAVLMCSAISLVGCKADMEKVYTLEEKEIVVSFEEVGVGYEEGDTSGDTRSFYKEDESGNKNYKVYNSEKFVGTYVGEVEVYGKYFTVENTTGEGESEKTLYSAYDTNGNVLYEKLEEPLDIVFTGIFAVVGRDYYLMKDEKIDFSSKKSVGISDDLRIVNNIQYAYGDYFYNIENKKEFFAYNKDLQLIAYYAIPENMSVIESCILSNGDFLLQVRYTATEDSDDYTYINDKGAKFCLKNIIVDVSKNKVSIKDSDYIFIDDYILNGLNAEGDIIDFTEYGYSEKLDNLAFIKKIEDKIIINKGYAVTINNKGNYSEIKTFIDNQQGTMSRIDDNLFKVRDYADNVYLVNEDGKVIGSISSSATYLNGLFIIEDDGDIYVYNKDLTLKKEYKSTEKVAYTLGYYCIIETNSEGEKEVIKYYTVADGEIVELPGEPSRCNGGYTISTTEEGGAIANYYYSNEGKLIVKTNSILNVTAYGYTLTKGDEVTTYVSLENEVVKSK